MRRPRAPWHNAVLQSRQERDRAIAQVTRLGLPPASDAPKNWDSLAALDCVLAHTDKRARVLDAGAELYSRTLPWLRLYGYKRLTGINLAFKKRKRVGPITYAHGDLTRSGYDAGTFDAITCLSVLEHGVDLAAYFREMARILKPGGVLITSTDYWETPIDAKGRQAYGVPVHVFTRREIRKAIKIAGRNGLVLTGRLDLACDEKVVHWQEADLDFTFLVFTFKKV